MKILGNYFYTITRADIYGSLDIEKAIEGYEDIDFRPALAGETILSSESKTPAMCEWGYPEPRLILRKKKPRSVTFVECSKEEAKEYDLFRVCWTRASGQKAVDLFSDPYKLVLDEFYCKPEAEQ